ncbi:MAG TPA: cysteine synthase A, partial [Cobetia sp.]|nr:cysteine synthase A [Cobetia sp.]
GGTISGIARYFKTVRGQSLEAVAVEPAESAIITQRMQGESITPAPHKIQGIG